LSAIVPAGSIIVTSCTLIAHNVVARLRPATSERAIFALTRWLTFPVTLAALGLALVAPALIVVILLVAYDFIAQLLPAVVIGGLFWRRATLPGVLAGILVGWGLSGWWLLTKQDPIWGLNAGLVALLANIAVFFVVSLATRPPEAAVVDPFMQTVWRSGRAT
jgi:SSS family solute:Na+ symporter